MAIHTVADLWPGQRLKALNQGQTLTPYSSEVEVVWVSDVDVHYRIIPSSHVFQTPITRFLEVINGTR